MALLVLVGCAGCEVGEDLTGDLAGEAPGAREVERVYWHAGTFRTLPALHGELIAFVDALPHPNSGGYGRVSTARAQRFRSFLDAMFEAIDLGLRDGNLPDWCAVQAAADDAGYELRRFRDETTGRWLLYGSDRTAYGQAYFFVNPRAKRNLVVETPHEPYDTDTAVQGTRIFLELAARALVINKEHRCSDSEEAACDHGTTSSCGGVYRQSDVAHNTDNTFHLLHVWLSDHDASTKFVQLHGFKGGADDRVEVGDGTYTDVDADSVSVAFARHLRKHVPSAGAVHACQESGSTPAARCGNTNVQGRYTNGRSGDECTDGARYSSNRFLHIEQASTVRDADRSDGWWWGCVRDGLRDTWPACDLGTGSGDCDLGGRQTDYDDCVCGETCQ